MEWGDKCRIFVIIIKWDHVWDDVTSSQHTINISTRDIKSDIFSLVAALMALPSSLVLAPDSQDEKDQVDSVRIRALADRFKNARCPPTIISANLKGPFQVSPFATQKSLSPAIVTDQKDSFTKEIPCEISKLLKVTNVGFAKEEEQEGVAEIITGEPKDPQYPLAKDCGDIQCPISKSLPSRPSESTETIEDISASSLLSDEHELPPSTEGSLSASLSPALTVIESRLVSCRHP